MPIYEYSCKKCGDVIEHIQKFSDPPLRKHAGCGGALTKLISQSAFQLKGTGWYVTDYAKSGSGPDNGGSQEAGSTEKEKSPAKPDKKEKTSTPKETSGSKK